MCANPEGSGVDANPDEALAGALRERGLVPTDKLDQSISESVRLKRPLTEILIANGYLSPAQVDSILSEAAGVDPTRIGKYSIVRKIGRGGMGVVYEAVHAETNQSVALKTMFTSPHPDPVEAIRERDRFLREGRLTAALPPHPNVVGVFETGIHQGVRFIAMELVRGMPFDQWRRLANPPMLEQIRVIRDAALGAHHAHEHGVIHRDLKPANILVDDAGVPHLTDFGLAKPAGGTSDGVSLTGTGVIVGTPAYMSPEQVQGLKTLDPRSDIYSIGVMLYEVLTGRAPFTGESAIQILMKVVGEVPTAPTRFAGIDPLLEAICLKAMAKDLKDRYGTMKEFADEVTRWLGREPAAKAGAKGWKIAAASLLAGALAATGIFFVVRRDGESPPLAPASADAATVATLPPSSKTGRSQPPPAAAGPAVDLLALVDPVRDAIDGPFKMANGELVVVGWGRIALPYQPPESYELRVSFTRTQGTGHVLQILTNLGRAFSWKLGMTCAFQVAGRNKALVAPLAETTGEDLANGRRYESVVQVRKDQVAAWLDGKPIATWKTDFNEAGLTPERRLPDSWLIGLGAQDATVTFHRVLIAPLEAGAVEGHADPPAPPAPGSWRVFDNLLPKLRTDRDTVFGGWKFEGATLVSDLTGTTDRMLAASGSARIEIPLTPPEEYDFRITFTVISGTIDVGQILTKDTRTFKWTVAQTDKAKFGFHLVNGRHLDDNPTTISRATPLELGRRYTSLVKVRNDRVEGYLDGTMLCRWRTNFEDLGSHQLDRLRDERRLGLSTFRSSVVFHSAELREAPASERRPRPPEPPAAEDGSNAPFLVAGPFLRASASANLLAREYGPELGGSDTLTYQDDLGWPVRWRRGRAAGYVLDLARMMGAPRACAYALTQVFAPERMEVYLFTGSDEMLRLWVNGKLVLEVARNRDLKLDEEVTKVSLNQGWNRVLAKVENTGGVQWALALRVAQGLDKSPVPGLRFDRSPKD